MSIDDVIADLEHIQQIRVTSELHNEAVKYLKEYRALQWHYISKELPGKWGWYLVTIEYGLNGERCVDIGEYSATLISPTEKKWWVHGKEEHDIIAWMPLPTPAEAENE